MSDECEFCPDGHEAPERRPWAVWVDTVNLDHDGQPTRLIVSKTGGQIRERDDGSIIGRCPTCHPKARRTA